MMSTSTFLPKNGRVVSFPFSNLLEAKNPFTIGLCFERASLGFWESSLHDWALLDLHRRHVSLPRRPSLPWKMRLGGRKPGTTTMAVFAHRLVPTRLLTTSAIAAVESSPRQARIPTGLVLITAARHRSYMHRYRPGNLESRC